jgi:hypothetical protein
MFLLGHGYVNDPDVCFVSSWKIPYKPIDILYLDNDINLHRKVFLFVEMVLCINTQKWWQYETDC